MSLRMVFIMKKVYIVILSLAILTLFCSCKAVGRPVVTKDIKDEESTQSSSSKSSSNVKDENQDFSYIDADGETVAERIRVPKDFFRGETSDYGEYLRSVKVKPDGSKVRLFNGFPKLNQGVHVAVLDVDVGDKDLQQCADAVLRLRCEYLYANEKDEMINYHLTSGDEFPYEKYRDGYRLVVLGNSVNLVKAGSYDRSYERFRKYLIQLFSYAGTLSISRESKNVEDSQMEIGDIFIKGGSPGHCVLVIDMCENDEGEKMFLLAQSYMPAQDIHILKNPNSEDDSPWYSLDDLEYPLETPEWTFDKGSLKRLP